MNSNGDKAKVVAVISQQEVYDKFSFLEGVVNEHYYNKIAETTIALIGCAVLHPGALMAGNDAIRKRDRQIEYLKHMLHAYGLKALQYDIEHPNDGLNEVWSEIKPQVTE